MDINLDSIYPLFGGEEEFNAWFKTILRDELERRQLAQAREEANRVMQQASFVIPTELM